MTTRIGTFIKTPAPHVVEVLGACGLDFGLVDAEHGPFDRSNVDIMMLAARAVNWPLFVRTPDDAAATLLWALDLGAAALVVPHVDTADQAAAIVRNSRFGKNGRGFSSSPRFALYGAAGFARAVELGGVAEIFCQIESPEAVGNAAAIAAIDGVDGLVIGRADLALAMGLDRPGHPQVRDASRQVIGAAVGAGKAAVIVTGGLDEVAEFRAMGATMFIVASDHALLRSGAQALVTGWAGRRPQDSLTDPGK